MTISRTRRDKVVICGGASRIEVPLKGGTYLGENKDSNCRLELLTSQLGFYRENKNFSGFIEDDFLSFGRHDINDNLVSA